MTDIVTYCDVNTCEDCPRHGDDCDGSAEKLYTHKEAWGMTDLIRREDAIAYIERVINSGLGRSKSLDYIHKYISALPSANVEPTVIRSKTLLPTKDFKEWAKRVRETNPNVIVIPCDAEVVSADAVPQLRQTDTLIIADALRYLAKDTERHLVDRTRADALRQQFLKYGASMCKGGDTE